MEGADLVPKVTTARSYNLNAKQPQWNVTVYDFGAKGGILRNLQQVGCNVTVVPANTTAEHVLPKQS